MRTSLQSRNAGPNLAASRRSAPPSYLDAVMSLHATITQRLPVAARAALAIALLPLAGCAARHSSLLEAFPVGSTAAPWNLDGHVWCGTFAEAMPALGDDADRWRDPQPTRVWLAIYHHETDSDRRLIARAFEFQTRAAAHTMYQRIRPAAADAFRAGDEGCWTADGVLFVWGRLVFDVFASPSGWQNELQAAMLAQYIQKQMPPGLPDAPP
jgi:hypothetical protein